MKNCIGVVLILSFLISGCSNLKYLKKFGGFKGQPKKVESVTYKINYLGGVKKEELSKKDIYLFDSKGREIKHMNFRADGNPGNSGTKSIYDKYGNIIKEISLNRDSTKMYQSEYTYNKYGQEIKMVYSNNRRTTSTFREFDRKNRTAVVVRKNGNGLITDKSIEKYDKKWRNIEKKFLETTGVQSSRVEYSYNENNCKIESKRYNSQNEMVEIYKDTYNRNNHRIKKEKFREVDGEFKLISASHTKHIYDEKRNCIEHSIGPIDKPSWVIKISYEYY